MTRSRTKEQQDEQDGTTIPVVEGVPEWATPDVETQQVEVYVPPSPSQFRRKLTGPELLGWVSQQVVSYDGDEEAMGLDIFSQVAEMTSADAILSGQVETTKGKSLLNIPLVCDRIKFVMSTEAQGCPYFAILDVRRSDTNERLTVSKGGWRFIAQLGGLHYMAAELPQGSPFVVPEGFPGAIAKDTYPFYFKIMETRTGSGNDMSYIVGLMN